MSERLRIIGGGLAGCEAAWQAAKRGVQVDLYEMRPHKKTPAHETSGLAELVCSNSFRSNSIENASGLLKEEMRKFDSLILRGADSCRVPAGLALAVDRSSFSKTITETIENDPRITIHREEIRDLEEKTPTIVATGPLTSDSLSAEIARLTQGKYLYFYDAISPILHADSIDMSMAFTASRYGKGNEEGGEGDYLNLGLNESQYYQFVEVLLGGEKIPLREFERAISKAACLSKKWPLAEKTRWRSGR